MIKPEDIAVRRKALGLSRKELGELTYTSEQHVGAIERGISTRPNTLLLFQYVLDELEDKKSGESKEAGYKLAQTVYNILKENPNHPFVESAMGDIMTLTDMMNMDMEGAERFVNDFNEYNEIGVGTIVRVCVNGRGYKGLVTSIDGDIFDVFVFDLNEVVPSSRAGLFKLQERLTFEMKGEKDAEN